MSREDTQTAGSRAALPVKRSISYRYPSGNSPMRVCCTFVTLLGAHPRSGASTMSRTIRTLALSAALLAATTGSAFASAPTGTNPPPTETVISIFMSFLGL
jgi:hypothetical protein